MSWGGIRGPGFKPCDARSSSCWWDPHPQQHAAHPRAARPMHDHSACNTTVYHREAQFHLGLSCMRENACDTAERHNLYLKRGHAWEFSWPAAGVCSVMLCHLPTLTQDYRGCWRQPAFLSLIFYYSSLTYTTLNMSGPETSSPPSLLNVLFLHLSNRNTFPSVRISAESWFITVYILSITHLHCSQQH